jgi:uncharacterized protein (DUF3084 family)
MAKEPTKTELAALVSKLDEENARLRERVRCGELRERKLETERKDTAERLERALAQMLAGRQAITQALQVRHEAEITPVMQYGAGGGLVEAEQPNEDVRFLRYLYGLLPCT